DLGRFVNRHRVIRASGSCVLAVEQRRQGLCALGHLTLGVGEAQDDALYSGLLGPGAVELDLEVDLTFERTLDCRLADRGLDGAMVEQDRKPVVRSAELFAD